MHFKQKKDVSISDKIIYIIDYHYVKCVLCMDICILVCVCVCVCVCACVCVCVCVYVNV